MVSADQKPAPAAALDAIKSDAAEVDSFLKCALKDCRDYSGVSELFDAIEYSVFAGGKRLRPALTFASFRAVAGDASPGKAAFAAAGALELVHTFSLVHDDLPAMDDDDLRRGRATNHKVFGEAMAILAGDAMMTLAFELIATDVDAPLVGPLIRELASAAGPAGMIGGQVLDISSENQSLSLENLSKLHAMKTGALLTAACRLGAIAGGATETQLAALTKFGRHLGLAFQIADDVLDITATAEQLGKQTNKDVSHGKNTYPALLGLDGARSEMHQQLRLAHASLDGFDELRVAPLRSIADFVVNRDH